MSNNKLKSHIRVKCTRKSVENNKSNLKTISWSEKEKKTLLIALKKYGYTDIENISNEFPNKPNTAIKTMISKLRLTANKCVMKRENQIDIWLNSDFFNENDTVIPQALKFISLFENHPHEEKISGHNFKKLYDTLSKVTYGVPPLNIPQLTYEIISYILTQITREIWPSCESNICEYIDNLVRNKIINCYPPKKSTSIK